MHDLLRITSDTQVELSTDGDRSDPPPVRALEERAAREALQASPPGAASR